LIEFLSGKHKRSGELKNEDAKESRRANDKWALTPSDVAMFQAEKLGSGAFADVYRGLLIPRNMEVAVKVAKDASDKAR
ncbi:hypothetical protein AAVH_14551, partial [Aphelenchoides avenae]